MKERIVSIMFLWHTITHVSCHDVNFSIIVIEYHARLQNEVMTVSPIPNIACSLPLSLLHIPRGKPYPAMPGRVYDRLPREN